MKRENRNFLVALLGAVALTLNSNNAAAQTVAIDNAAQEQVLQVKNHRERLWQVLDQSRANDYVPVFFNIHFDAKQGWKAVQSHIDWLRTTHVDIVNVKYEYFPKIQRVESPADWKNIREWDTSEWEEQLLVVRELKRELGDDLEEFGGKVFQDILKPYDRQLSDVAAEVAPFNILHICESGGHFTAETFNDYLDYPGSVINPPLHNWQGKGLTLKEISSLFRRPVLGGLNNRGAIKDGTWEELKAEIDQILENAPQNFIFGADDSLPNDVDQEKVRRAVDYIHTWRVTHNKELTN